MKLPVLRKHVHCFLTKRRAIGRGKKEKRCSDFESTTLINAALYRRLTCTICTIGGKVALRLFNSDISAMELNEDEEESRCWRGFRLDKFLRLKEVIPVHFAC